MFKVELNITRVHQGSGPLQHFEPFPLVSLITEPPLCSPLIVVHSWSLFADLLDGRT